MKIHYLKIWPDYFDLIYRGEKTFELRKNDRDFKKGDLLILREFIIDTCEYTGEEITCEVTYITNGPSFGLQEGFCCMGIKPRFI